ncbi:hypothetical protein RUND412_008233 [Rhizina undulata]
MKQRFSSLDLQIIAHELSATLTGYRLSNIYDLTSRIFLLKFAKPESKHLLVIDSGFRCHLTSFSRATATTPSSFVSRLRKFLRTRRLTKCRQIGTDRVLELEFTDGLYRLYLEFYAGGNVILVDKESTILAVLRIVPAGEDGRGECKVGAKYNVEVRPSTPRVTLEKITDVLKNAAAKAADTEAPVVENEEAPTGGKKKKPGKFQSKQKKKKEDGSIKRVLGARISEFSPALIEHSFRFVGVDPELHAKEVLEDETLLQKVFDAFQVAEKTIKGILEGDAIKGYIIAKQPTSKAATAALEKEKKAVKSVSFGNSEAVEVAEDDQIEEVQVEGEAKGLVFDDFHPFCPKQFENVPEIKILEYEGFNKTVDTFFSSIESQKLESRLKEREATAIKRLEAARTDHKRRVETLRSDQELHIRKAQAIEANLGRVEEAISAVNGLIARGMDWVAMGRFIEQEQKRGNAVAEIIKLPLKLHENTITVNLQEDADEGYESDEEDNDESASEESPFDESDNEDDRAEKTLSIDIDLSLSGWANARQYYGQKKTAAVKEEKTIQSSSKALKSTERKIQADLQKGLKQEKQLLRPVRQAFWFEKFIWFISSDGYLVLAGRDLQQNDMLYMRYFKRGDKFVTADIEGAATVIVKNRVNAVNAPVPPATLQQAGTLAVATSKAWDNKSVLSAWWVEFEQVAKTGTTGEYLPVGKFEIKGKKNFLPPAQLILGFGILWLVDEESKARHVKYRLEAPKSEQDDEEVEEDVGEEASGDKTEAKSQEHEEQEDSDEEEFPDAQIELDQVDQVLEQREESENEEFPDASIDDHFPEAERGAEGQNIPTSDEAQIAETAEEADKYGLKSVPAPGSILEDQGSRTTTSSSAYAKKYLTAKQRRDVKKGHTPDSGTGASTPITPSRETPTPSTSKTNPLQRPEKQAPQTRGKKSKQKKIAARYAHQDEEDRALALQLLGSSNTSQKVQDPAAEKAQKLAAEAERKKRLREQHSRALRVAQAAEASRFENDGEEEEEDVGVDLDRLVHTAFVGDTILEAIPVCAPWTALGKCKYKVKLQPGTDKKGKAVKGIVGRWVAEGEKKMDAKSVDVEKAWPREVELVKAWREEEIINCVPVSKLKIMGGASSGGASSKGKGGQPKGKGKAKGGKKK